MVEPLSPQSRPFPTDPRDGENEQGEGAGSSLSLTSQIYNKLRTDVLCHRLEPGQKLKIEDLRNLYGVGASPLREALSLLTSDGLVERLEQRGFRVSKISQEEFTELMTTRTWLEERALRESISKGDRAWEEQVLLAAYRLKRTPRSMTPDRFVGNDDWERHHKQFHMSLLSACGSSFLLQFCNHLYDLNIRYRSVSNRSAFPQRDITAEHDAICKAALERQAEVAVAALKTHYRQTGSYLGPGALTPTS